MWRSFLTWRPWFWGIRSRAGRAFSDTVNYSNLSVTGYVVMLVKAIATKWSESTEEEEATSVITVGKRASTRCSSYSMAVKKPIGRRTHTQATWLHGAASELSMYSRSVSYMKGVANKQTTGPHSRSCSYNIWVGSKNVQFWQVSEWHQIRDLGAIV